MKPPAGGAISGPLWNYIYIPWKDGELGGGHDGAISGWIGNYIYNPWKDGELGGR